MVTPVLQVPVGGDDILILSNVHSWIVNRCRFRGPSASLCESLGVWESGGPGSGWLCPLCLPWVQGSRYQGLMCRAGVPASVPVCRTLSGQNVRIWSELILVRPHSHPSSHMADGLLAWHIGHKDKVSLEGLQYTLSLRSMSGSPPPLMRGHLRAASPGCPPEARAGVCSWCAGRL